MPVLLALLSSLASSVDLVLQRDSSGAAPADVRGRHLAAYLLRNPRWLLGQAAWVAAFALQALALHVGRLSVVQPVLVAQLVFTLLIRRFVTRWHVRAAAWGSAGLLSASLVVFLIASEPRGGHPFPTPSAWGWAALTTGGAAVAAAAMGRTGSPARRAACYATASAVLAALSASLVKTAVQTWSTAGLSAMLTDWPVYALVAAGTLTTLLVQTALRVGPLTVSQPLLVVVNPLTSIALSIWLFGEHFSHDPGAIALGGCAFVGLVAGVFLLTATGPRPEAATGAPPVRAPLS